MAKIRGSVPRDVANFVHQQALFDPDRLARGWVEDRQIRYAFLEDYVARPGTLLFDSVEGFLRWVAQREASVIHDAPVAVKDDYFFKLVLTSHGPPAIFRARLVKSKSLFEVAPPYSLLVPNKLGTEVRLYQVGAPLDSPVPTSLLSPTFMMLRKTRIYEISPV